jgi:hypothetical protein
MEWDCFVTKTGHICGQPAVLFPKKIVNFCSGCVRAPKDGPIPVRGDQKDSVLSGPVGDTPPMLADSLTFPF